MHISEHLETYNPTPLSSLLENLENKFRVIYPTTLFPPNWEALLTHNCPLCGCKIYEMRDKPLWHCRSNKHKKFIIRDSVLVELASALEEKKERLATA